MARWMCESVGMRRDVTVEVSAADRARLEAVVADRNSPQKHVWRAKVILATADGLGTAEIMRRRGKSKPSVWRWQGRFMTGVRQVWLRHSAAVKRTAKEGEPNGRNTREGDGAGGLVGAPPRSWRRQVRRRATCATLLGEAEAADGEPAAAGRASGAAGTGAQRHGGAVVGVAGSGFVGRRGGPEGARARRPRRRDRAAEGEGRRDDHGDRAVAGEDCPPRGRRPLAHRRSRP